MMSQAISIFALVSVSASVFGATAESIKLSSCLAGSWAFELDPDDVGVNERWYLRELPETIQLPGSTEERGFGEPNTEPEMYRFTRLFRYFGPAWYQKEVLIPDEWKGMHISLSMERVQWTSHVWVDDVYAGEQDSLSTPHVHNLSPWLTPGRHRITVRVDNRPKINIGVAMTGVQYASANTDETQTNWNGIVGSLVLRARPLVRVNSIQTYPDISERQTRVLVGLVHDHRENVQVQLTARVIDRTTGNVLVELKSHVDLDGVLRLPQSNPTGWPNWPVFKAPEHTVEMVLPFWEGARLWDEFDPVLYDLHVSVEADGLVDTLTTVLAFRDFKRDGQHFTLNGRRVSLRGNVECGVFPLTGYPPTDKESWERLIRNAKDCGLNHIRFHSWCPPRIAFEAADEAGFMLQVESPLWDGHGLIGRDADRAAYIRLEIERILATYGNHPSFCLLSIGNELGDGKELYLQHLVEVFQKTDPRRLYTCTTHPSDLTRNDMYFVSAGTENGAVRGIGASGGTDTDFYASLAEYDRPLLSHEVGQYTSYPDFHMARKFTGPLRAACFDVYAEKQRASGLEAIAPAMTTASSRFAFLLYKEEVEKALRTSNLAGFQLLSLHDHPGYGIATIGIFDFFWDPKPGTSAEEFRRFCGPTVPLLRAPKREWTAGESYSAMLELSHFGPENMENAQISWKATTAEGQELAEGTFIKTLETGGITHAGEVAFTIPADLAPARFRVEVSVDGTDIVNDWNNWVYPVEVEDEIPDSVYVSSLWDTRTKDVLRQGGIVLYVPEAKTLKHATQQRFLPAFWATSLFAQPTGMGTLSDPSHPVFDWFPNDGHSDWQWHDLLHSCEALDLTTATSIEPIVRYIDDFTSCRPLAALFEVAVGEGRLMVSTLNLGMQHENRSASVRMFRHGLFNYMTSEQFAPSQALSFKQLDVLFEGKVSAVPVEDLARAVMYVVAGDKVAPGVSPPWEPAHDTMRTMADGFNYAVEDAYSYRDAISSCWHGQNMRLRISCPRGFEGTLLVHLWDWSAQNRSVALFFEGRDLGPVSDYTGDGHWLRLPVTSVETDDGELVRTVRNTAGPNATISSVVLLAD